MFPRERRRATFANLGKDLIGPKHSANHKQVLSMATVDAPKLAGDRGASEGGPPTPIGLETS